jgi:hypothetical protein
MPQIRCPHCQRILEVHASYAGKFIACEKCGKGINIPANFAAASKQPSSPAAIPSATAAATSSAALAHNLPGSGTITGEPDSLKDMPCDPIPADAGQAVTELGTPICSIKTASVEWAKYAGVGVGGLGVVLFFYSLIAIAAGIGPVGSRVAPLILGLIFLAGGVLSFVLVHIEAQRTLWLCPNGLLWSVQGKTDHCHWEDVKELYVLVAHVTITGAYHSRRLVYKYIFKTENGFRMQMHSDEMHGTKTVGEFIQEQTTKVLLPQYRKQFRERQPLTFGVIEMDDQGLSVKGKQMSWAKVGRVEVEEGNVVLGKSGDRAPVLVAMEAVSHVLIFLQLAGETSGNSG